MKIRNGFVSNSSSTSFVVCIPKNFVPSEEELDKLDCFCDVTDEIKKKFISKVIIGVEEIKDGGLYYSYDDGLMCDAISELCENKGFVLNEMNTGPEEGQLMGVDAERIKHIIDWKRDEN